MTIEADLSKPARTDNVADTINYLTVFETVREQMKIPSHILEHVARRIIDAIRLRFAVRENSCEGLGSWLPPLGGKIEKVSVTLEE